MKDISTVRYQPQRLWEWAEIAMEVAEECQLVNTIGKCIRATFTVVQLASALGNHRRRQNKRDPCG